MSIIIIIVCLIVYWKTLGYKYCIDDYQASEEHKKDPATIPKILWLKILYSFQSKKNVDPKIDHATTIFIHTFNSVLIYHAFGASAISFLAAVLFAIHPAGTQGSIWIAGRGYAKATMWILLMFTFKWFAPIFYWFAAPGFNAFLSPIVFLFTDFPFWIMLIPLVAIFQRKQIEHQINSKIAITPELTKKFSWNRFPLYFKTLGYYTIMGLLPWRLGVYHTYLYTFGLSKEETNNWLRLDKYFWVGVFVIYVLAVNLFYGMSSALFGLFWFVALISQWCNFPIIIQQTIAERYLYLPLIGLMWFLANMLVVLPYSSVLIGAFVSYYLVRLLLHMPSYRNIYTQCEYNTVDFPTNHMSWTWKGLLDKARGSHFTALECWFRGWKLRRNDFRLNNNIAVLLTEMGNIKDATQFIKIAEENIPPDQKENGKAYIMAAKNNIVDMRNQIKKNKSHG